MRREVPVDVALGHDLCIEGGQECLPAEICARRRFGPLLVDAGVDTRVAVLTLDRVIEQTEGLDILRRKDVDVAGV